MEVINKIKIIALVFILALFPTVISACAAPIESAADYSISENWAYYEVGDGEADLFLICPTVYVSDESFNMPINDDEQRQRFINALHMQRGIYERNCRMYAPFYSQASLDVYSMENTEATAYFDIAYADIRAAFTYYWENCNDGRPVVLAGFSQGADMALRLMKEFYAEQEKSELLVAAYLIGWPVTDEDISSYPFLKMAEGEADTGVIVSFNTEAENVNSSIVVPDKTLGINPLNWSTGNDFVPKEFNKGACFFASDGSIKKEIPHLTGAYMDPLRGTLKATDVLPSDYPPVLEIFDEGVYHIYDYQFFYRNLQDNVDVRIEAFKSKAGSAQQYFSAWELKGKRVGVGMGYGADVSVTNLGIYDVHRYLSAADLPIALKAGNVDAIVMEQSEAKLYAEEVPGLVILPEIIGSEKYVAICNKKNSDLGKAVDAAIGEIINSPVYAEMKDRWLSGSLESTAMPDIPRPKGEKLVAAISSEYMPFEYLGEAGEHLGFDVELILRIGALMDREIEFFETSYTSLFPAIDSGYADICISVIDDKPALREKYFVSRPYYDNVIVMLVETENNKQEGFMQEISRVINNNLFVEKRYMYILEGLLGTLMITVIAAFFGTLLGALLCAMIRGKQWFLKKAALLYLRIMHGTPIIVLLIFITYVVLAGSGVDTVIAASLAFSLYFSAKVSEIFRAGLDSIEKGQIEASKAMGLSGFQAYRLVLIPQAAVFSMPLYCMDLVEMLKLTSVVGYVGIMDITYALEVIRSRTYDAIFPLFIETLIYIFLTTLLTGFFSRLSSRIDPLKKERRIRL